MDKREQSDELLNANKELAFQNEEKEKLATELKAAYKEIAFQIEERGKRAAELAVANIELAFQNKEKEKRAEELTIANSELKKAEADIRKLNAELEQKIIKRTSQYAFISQINQTIVHVTNVETLFRNSCRIALEFGKFKMAWIGSFDIVHKKITLLDSSGISEQDIKLFTDAPYETNGPQGNVMRTGKYYLCNDIEHTLELESWKPYAAKHNIRSCIVLPIKKEGRIFGTFNLYATELNFFDKDDIALLIEVTGDISFALDLFEKAERHKEAEELILKNEKGFRALIENSADMKTLSGVDGKPFYASPSITKVLGYTTEEALNIPPPEIIHPDDFPIFVENVQKILLTTGSSIYSQQRLKHKNGNYIWCEGTITNLLHEPNVNAMVSNFRDISERKLAQDNLEQSEAKLKEAQTIGHIGNWEVDLFANTSIWSDEFYDIFGINRELIPSTESLLSLLHPDDVSHASEKIAQSFQTNESGSFNSRFIKKDDGIRYIYTEWKFEFDKNKKAVRLFGILQDITEAKQAEESLRKSESNLQAIIENTDATIYSLDNEFRYIAFNKLLHDTLQQIYGLDIKIGDHVFSFLEKLDAEEANGWKEIYSKAFKGETVKFEKEFIIGDFHNYSSFTIYPIWENQTVIGLSCYVYDITKQKKDDQLKEKMAADLIQRNRDLEQFTFIISHNLRAPAATIMGCAAVLLDHTPSLEEQRKLLKGLSISAAALDTVIKDINTILQVKREINEKKEVISFSKVVSDTTASIGNLIDKHNVRINADFSEVDEIYSLKIYMYSIFYNLISNSIKYGKPDEQPLIEIKSKKENEKIIITFKDNGLGIDMKTKGDKMFGLYKRFHSHVEGKGMGLFMVKTQIEALGGEISAASEPGKGIEFTIVFKNKT
jgi:PAS domain S-box-containing protein